MGQGYDRPPIDVNHKESPEAGPAAAGPLSKRLTAEFFGLYIALKDSKASASIGDPVQG
jgi:hypothetical protein